jgi:hypothetical protein
VAVQAEATVNIYRALRQNFAEFLRNPAELLLT